MTFSAKTLSLLVLISIGLSGLALLVTATGSVVFGKDPSELTPTDRSKSTWNSAC